MIESIMPMSYSTAVCLIACLHGAEGRKQDLCAQSKVSAASALPVLVIDDGRSKPCLDLRTYDCALSFGVEDPTLGLSRAKTNNPTCHVLPGFSLQVTVGLNRVGIVQRSNRFPQGSHGDAVTIPCGRTKVPP
jgi:hypothetical protein